jgi:hypothetical protein
MEISAIPGIRAMPVMKAPPADSDLSRVLDIDSSSQPGDDSYSGNGKKALGGQDNEAEDVGDGTETAPTGQPAEDGQGMQVNFFA